VTGNPNARLEAFCDGVFAIALTLLIIDVRIPATTPIATNADLWRALRDLLPTVFAFVLSFGIILINWVNHHETFKLINKSSGPFIYANGLLLLGTVLVPFPTALLGDNLLTSHAAPAVVLYSATGALMSLGWSFIGRTAFRPESLARNEHAAAQLREGTKKAYFAFAFYTTCSIVAVWQPMAIAVIITLMWAYWVIYGIRATSESVSA
jgi:uncharacterized membrane protein